MSDKKSSNISKLFSSDKKSKKVASREARFRKERSSIIGSGMSFLASEAYRRFRTNVVFSFPADKASAGRSVGITSASAGEGKSITAINLARNLAMNGKRTILLECDMRKPTVAKRLGLNQVPGISDALIGEAELSECFHAVDYSGERLYVMVAGSIPPNPAELLGSRSMELLLSGLRERFEYIILDLPPVAEVSDAVAIAPKLDGVCVVVRQGETEKAAIKETIRQLRFVGANLLGFVFNSITDGSTGGYYKYKKYGRYSKYSKYGKYYYGGNED